VDRCGPDHGGDRVAGLLLPGHRLRRPGLVADRAQREAVRPVAGSKGVHDIDFQWDTGKPAATATITADAGFHDLAPGSPVTLQKLGPANGSWLVETIERSTYSKKVTVSAIRPQPVLPEPKDQAAANAAALGNLGIPVFRGDYLGDASAGSTIDNSFRLAPTGATGIGALTQVTSERFVQARLRAAGEAVRVRRAGPELVGLRRVHVLVREAGRGVFPNPVVGAGRDLPPQGHDDHGGAGGVHAGRGDLASSTAAARTTTSSSPGGWAAHDRGDGPRVRRGRREDRRAAPSRGRARGRPGDPGERAVVA
jgi:hypothetical protein